MWKEFKILQKSYFMKCSFSADKKVTLILYDHQEFQSWYETLEFDEVKRKVKQLNRRYDFNEENILAAFTGSEAELKSASLEVAPVEENIDKENKVLLKLNYRVKNCPFHYKWSLTKQTMHQFQEIFVKPLFTALTGFQEQLDILTETLKKKDAEILQYRIEGAILGRKTLATKLFDFEEFGRKYENGNKIVKDFAELGQILANSKPEEEICQPSTSKAEKQNIQQERKPIEKVVPVSPGQRTRNELKQQMLEKALNTRAKVGLNYENSQSQSFTESQTHEEPSKNVVSLATGKSETITRQRRSSMYAEANEKEPKHITRQTEKKQEHKTPEKATTWSPGQRKRKSVQPNQLLESTLKTCKKGLEYESSSQSQTMSSCQSSEEAEKANKADTDWNPAKPENKTQPIMKRRSSRCVPLDENILKKHNNDKSESESDGSVFNVPRSRQSRQLCQSQDDTTDNDDDRNKKKDNKTKNSTTDIEAVDKVKDSNLKEVSKDKTDIGKGDDKTKKCSSSNTRDQQQKVAQSIPDNIPQQTNQKLGNDNAKNTNDPKQQSDVTQILSDSDTVEVIVLSPQRKRRKSLSKHSHSRSPETFRKDLNAKASNEVGTSKSVHTIDTSDSESEIDLQRTPRKRKNLSLTSRSSDRKSTPSKQDKTKETKESTNKAGTDTDEAPQYVVEISTDSECSESQKNSSKLRKRIPSVIPESPSVAFSMKSRITRSSPQVLSTPKLSEDILSPKKDRKNNSTSNSSETPLVMGEISSQLEAIRKELECLEALRLADLKHRTCKA